ncbi:conjugal transfer protein TrbC [Salmonella enterica subsp. enterica serovar Salford]|nr:conjugal transfer protein TrbC [Salmonella enterica subsp. enterica serovar Salford]HBC0335464.1 type-F conjugative transfer system pilin assembly protein TrbC [Salmonella enterica subsp. enterica serovar Napoli]HBC0352956.1 type-F conjugative transfer system pilin assembly protein TrbC [Salmonella enterica subsp. enterica serovar Napoli]HBJ6783437.1 type-F conjugative transfer system pilin assembly protein TrbC [Salmonella enterica subsp. enterica serovar Salford]
MHRKIKYLTILIMVISGTVSAGGVANTPENRQFLKQQKELSRQLRDRPDAELKAWADRQIQVNPLIQSDRHFLDDLARKQQASQADKPEQGAAYFISFSIPEEGLKRMLRETRRYGIPATLRGMRDNDLKATADAVLSLVKDGVTDGVQIDPTLFTKYDIRSVPALVVYCRQGYDVIRGNLRVKQALEKVATAGDCRQAAGEILQKNKR